MTLTVGSLCSGYEGIGLGVGGDVVYVCDPEPAAALLLKAHHPDAPNHHDLKALAWAQTPVKLLTAGYPCQPFSGAGKRAGTDDPRHLWPWIAQGIAISRPPLVLLENVRGHLTLGWDTVLADLHRLGYDVRWTLIRAADVGAPHGRARLFALAADRDVHRWEASSRMPVARVEGDLLVHPEDGLFGSHPLPLAENGHVPMWSAGLMVDGVVWEQQALLGTAQYELLPTPATTDANGARNSTSGRGEGSQHHGGDTLSDLVHDGRLAPVLLPTPRTTDMNGAGEHGTGGLDLRTAVDLLPTPTSRDWKGANQRQDNTCLPGALLSTPLASDAGGGRGSTSGFGLRDDVRELAMLSTPRTGSMRTGRRAATAQDSLSGPSLAQQTEIMRGQLPHEFATWDQLPPSWQPQGESRWGRYAAAIARCEALTRPAPDPTLPTGKGGAQRLSPMFVEWMMMLPEGWVTGHGLRRDAQLKALGNGVVPAQARAAWQHLSRGLMARQAAA